MKWIKHLSATRRDERVARLVAKHGLVAYGLYWAVQEIIADQMEGPNPSCRVSYPVSMWSHQLSIYAPQVKKQLQWLADAGLMELSYSDDEIVITNTKLLKYRDEYSRKSGQAPDKVAPDIDIEQKEIKKVQPPPPKAPAFEVPDWVSRDSWVGFMEVRTKKRAPNTPRALSGIVRELEKFRACGMDPNAVLEQSTMRGYTGVFEVKSNGNGFKPVVTDLIAIDLETGKPLFEGKTH